MGILSSMYTGISGMRGLGEALSIYGDNIANAETVGFKTSRPEFQDVVAKSLKGLLGGNQIGRGVRLAAVNPIFSQGSLIQTESATDLAISGDGFFVLEGDDGRSYSRNGALHFSKKGELINADGYKVMGFQADPKSGEVTSKLGPMSVDRTVIDAKKSERVDMFMNLDLRVDPTVQFDPERADDTSHFATGVTVYDTVGSPHVLTVYFNRVEDGAWQWRAMAKGEDIQGGEPGKMVQQATGTLKFDTDGTLMEQQSESSFNFAGGSLADQKIEFNFGKSKAEGGPGTQVTQYGTESEVYKTLQDGYTAGTLAGLTFNDDGMLTAIYNNGQNLNISQLALAKVENPEGMFKMGQNRYRESRLSGQPTLGKPGGGGRGRITPKSVEQSTTDIANEFISLMNTQRNFQANSRVVSVADKMMEEVINMNR